MSEEPQAGKVGVIFSGGTVMSEVHDQVIDIASDQGLNATEQALLGGSWPGPDAPNFAIRRPVSKLSENMESTDWVAMAESVRDLVENEHVTSVVIFHGTDTMTFSATALSFLLRDLSVPVVLTGSNRASNEPQWDGPTNAHDAYVAAQALAEMKQGGVYISFSGIAGQPSKVHLGTAVRKEKPGGQAFFSENRDLVGTVENGEFHPQALPEPAMRTKPQFDDAVKFLKVLPSYPLDREAESTIRDGYHGVVVELYPCGTGPDTTQNSLTSFVRKVNAAGIVVVAALPKVANEHGTAEYVTTKALRDAGAVFVGDMLPETAYTKTMWALGQGGTVDETKRLIQTPIAGEMTRASVAGGPELGG